MIRRLFCRECSEKYSDSREFLIVGRLLTCGSCEAVYKYQEIPGNNQYASVEVVKHGKTWN